MRQLSGARRVFFVSSVLVLSGCGAGAPLPDEATITGLHFATSSAYPENPPPTNVDVTLTDPIPSRAIYEATLALPAFPSGTYNCPADLGYRYTIAFENEQAVAVTAGLNPGGCRDVVIAGMTRIRRSDDAYWALLAEKLGIDESTLFSVAGQ
jgi:hypothetical protein